MSPGRPTPPPGSSPASAPNPGRPEKRRPRSTTILALDPEGAVLHAVLANLRGADPVVTRQGSVRLSIPDGANPQDPAVLGKAIAQGLKSLGIDANQAVLGIPRTHTILRTLSLPPVRKISEIAAMVHFQIGRDLPFRLDEALLDFQVLDASPTPTHNSPGTPPPAPDTTTPRHAPTRVLAAVVRRETVEFYRSLARAAGVKLEQLTLQSVALARAAVQVRPDIRDHCVGLIALRSGEITFDVLVRGTLVFGCVGTLPVPAPESAPSTEAAPAATPASPTLADAALLEVVRSLHSFEGTAGQPQVTSFLVTGTTGAEEPLAQALENRFGLPAQTLGVSAPKSPTQPAGNSVPTDAARLTALGLALVALDPAGPDFNFLDPKLPPVPKDNRRVRRLAAIAGVLALVIGFLGFRSQLIRKRDQTRLELQQQLTLASKNLAGFRSIRTQARTLTDWSSSGRNWLDHLAFLSQILPPSRDLYLISLATSPRNTVALSARVRSGEIVDQLSTRLRAAGYSLKPPAITPVSDRFGFRFQVNLEIDVPRNFTNTLDLELVENRSAPSPFSSYTPASPATTPPQISPSPTPTAPPTGVSPNPNAPAEERPVRRFRRRPEGGARE